MRATGVGLNSPNTLNIGLLSKHDRREEKRKIIDCAIEFVATIFFKESYWNISSYPFDLVYANVVYPVILFLLYFVVTKGVICITWDTFLWFITGVFVICSLYVWYKVSGWFQKRLSAHTLLVSRPRRNIGLGRITEFQLL